VCEREELPDLEEFAPLSLGIVGVLKNADVKDDSVSVSSLVGKLGRDRARGLTH